MSKVVFTKSAQYDLLKIEDYIFYELKNANATKRIINGIVSASKKLSRFPTRHPIINDPFIDRFELRMTHFGNYNIFYVYECDKDIVHIVRVLYKRTDWQHIFGLD